MKNKENKDNRSNQLNPNNDAYWESRGWEERPEDWEDRLAVDNLYPPDKK
ncbi:MAG: hypothetical protein NC211_06985 [Alistipes senegalensis]|nr:hypothetical protein [Oxalobacter formigenes]MCM1281555.1 hypothetical protein [Alistipes senegalensis]